MTSPIENKVPYDCACWAEPFHNISDHLRFSCLAWEGSACFISDFALTTFCNIHNPCLALSSSGCVACFSEALRESAAYRHNTNPRRRCNCALSIIEAAPCLPSYVCNYFNAVNRHPLQKITPQEMV